MCLRALFSTNKPDTWVTLFLFAAQGGPVSCLGIGDTVVIAFPSSCLSVLHRADGEECAAISNNGAHCYTTRAIKRTSINIAVI